MPGYDTERARGRWMDYGMCKWGSFEVLDGFRFSAKRGCSPHLARYFLEKNEPRVAAVLDDLARAGETRPYVVAMSHYCPRRECLPERRFLVDPHLPRVSGCLRIDRQLRLLHPDAAIFGHTHLCWDQVVDAVRYVNWPLGSPREMRGQTRNVAGSGALVLYDGARGEAPHQWNWWGDWREGRVFLSLGGDDGRPAPRTRSRRETTADLWNADTTQRERRAFPGTRRTPSARSCRRRRRPG